MNSGAHVTPDRPRDNQCGYRLPPHLTQIKEPVNLAKEVIVGNVLIQTKIVEQSLRCRLRPHHRSAPFANQKENGITVTAGEQDRLNQ